MILKVFIVIFWFLTRQIDIITYFFAIFALSFKKTQKSKKFGRNNFIVNTLNILQIPDQNNLNVRQGEDKTVNEREND